MANPPVPKHWKDMKVVPPAERSHQQVEDLAELAKLSKNVPAARLVKMLKKEFNTWLDYVHHKDKSGQAKAAPKVIALFNAAVDSIESKAGGGTGEPPCGSQFGDPCQPVENADKINLERLALIIFQKLSYEARIESERYGWHN